MTAIKYMPRTKRYIVCDYVDHRHAAWNTDGTFSGDAGIAMAYVSRRFTTLSEAQEAMEAYKAYKSRYGLITEEV